MKQQIEYWLCRILGAEPYEEKTEEVSKMTIKESIIAILGFVGIFTMIACLCVAQTNMALSLGLAALALVLCAPWLVWANHLEPDHD